MSLASVESASAALLTVFFLTEECFHLHVWFHSRGRMAIDTPTLGPSTGVIGCSEDHVGQEKVFSGARQTLDVNINSVLRIPSWEHWVRTFLWISHTLMKFLPSWADRMYCPRRRVRVRAELFPPRYDRRLEPLWRSNTVRFHKWELESELTITSRGAAILQYNIRGRTEVPCFRSGARCIMGHVVFQRLEY